MAYRVMDRCIVGLCSWNILTSMVISQCCYKGETNRTPFGRTFLRPGKCGLCFLAPWATAIFQGPCVVDIIVGPVLVNAADLCITKGFWSLPEGSAQGSAEACCCVAAAGGLQEFDRLHWSLWKCSLIASFCVPLCGSGECGTAVKPLNDSAWEGTP